MGSLALGGGAAVAKARYDASNAHKVDGKHAVGASTGKNARAGKLVATYPGGPKKGKLPAGVIDWQNANYSSFDMTGIQRLFGTAVGANATSTSSGSYVSPPGGFGDLLGGAGLEPGGGLLRRVPVRGCVRLLHRQDPGRRRADGPGLGLATSRSTPPRPAPTCGRATR